jgi:hypothetical protein
MQFESLDNITREALIEKGLPIHYYVQYLSYGISCLRELNWDTLNTIKTYYLPINDYNACTIPADASDILAVGHIVNGRLVPWMQDDSIARHYYIENGKKLPFPSESEQVTGVVTDGDEHLGRLFNHGAGISPYRYKLMTERNEIQLASATADRQIAAECITDGMTLDASNKIHPYAIQAIKNYQTWHYRLNNRSFGLGDRQEAENQYYNELRKLRGRLSDLTIQDIIRISREGLQATPKQ